MHSGNKIVSGSFLEGNSFLPETGEFLNSPPVEKLLLNQWNDYKDIKDKADPPDFDKIFHTISSQISSQVSISEKEGLVMEEKQKNFHGLSKKISTKWFYSAAAVFIGLIFLGSVLYKTNVIQFSMKPAIEVTTSKGEKKEIILPDGTKVWLNVDSKIVYNEKFERGYRRVKLYGEAFFDVVKNPKWPFIVETSQLSIKVLGTKFNVKAYSDDKTIETTLESGLISLQQEGKIFGDKSIIIKPQQKATFSKKEQKLLLEDVDSERYTSWKEGRLVFDNEDIHEAMKKMERWYGIKISMIGEKRNDRITLTIKDESIEQAIKLLQYTTATDFTVEKLNKTGKRLFKYEPKKNDIK